MYMDLRVSKSSLLEVYDKGYRSFRWESELDSRDFDIGENVDFEKILAQKDYERKIQAIEPIKLYRSLMNIGPAECLDVLKAISTEQFTRILDYDVWIRGELSAKKAFQWLAMFGSVSKSEIYTRFVNLEEEYQLALLGPFIKVFEPDEYENLSDVEQDKLTSFPGNAIYYKITSDDPMIEGAIDELLSAVMQENMQYALSLVGHSAFVPPHENESLLLQFRNSRNEEDGFIPYQEALSCFDPLDSQMLVSKWKSFDSTGPGGITKTTEKLHNHDFLSRVMAKGAAQHWTKAQTELLKVNYIHLSNQISAAASIDPGDLHGVKRMLMQAHSLTGFSLQILSSGDLSLACKILTSEYPKTLFRHAMTVVHHYRLDIIDTLKKLGIEEFCEFEKNYASSKFGLCLDWIDIHLSDYFEVYFVELLKGLFNRFPLVPKHIESNALDSNAKIEFVALYSIESYNNLKVEGAAALQLAKMAMIANDGTLDCIEKVITRSIASVLVGGRFINRIFDQALSAKLLELSEAQIDDAMDRLFESVGDILDQEQYKLVLRNTEIPRSLIKTRVISHLSTIAMNLAMAIRNNKNDIPAMLNFLRNN